MYVYYVYVRSRSIEIFFILVWDMLLHCLIYVFIPSWKVKF